MHINYKEYTLIMRGKVSFGVDSTTIRVWPGQAVEEVAARVANGYDALVEKIKEKSV